MLFTWIHFCGVVDQTHDLVHPRYTSELYPQVLKFNFFSIILFTLQPQLKQDSLSTQTLTFLVSIPNLTKYRIFLQQYKERNIF
jgi:hypothetical protein